MASKETFHPTAPAITDDSSDQRALPEGVVTMPSDIRIELSNSPGNEFKEGQLNPNTPSTQLVSTLWLPGLILPGLVVLLAFLLASFPARNSDLWIHLASGRQLSQGDFPHTLQPSSATVKGSEHTWLYDLVTYGLYV